MKFEGIINQLNKNGFVYLDRVEDFSTFLSGIKGETFESQLDPKGKFAARGNTLSSRFGLGDFPFHTDGAAEVEPPNLIFLQFIGIASAQVDFKIFDFLDVSQIGEFKMGLGRNLFSVRNGPKSFISSIVTKKNGRDLFRFNPAIMKSLNPEAKKLEELISSLIKTNRYTSISPRDGSAVLLNNHRVMHARGRVSGEAIGKRSIKRIWIYTGEENDLG